MVPFTSELSTSNPSEATGITLGGKRELACVTKLWVLMGQCSGEVKITTRGVLREMVVSRSRKVRGALLWNA